MRLLNAQGPARSFPTPASPEIPLPKTRLGKWGLASGEPVRAPTAGMPTPGGQPHLSGTGLAGVTSERAYEAGVSVLFYGEHWSRGSKREIGSSPIPQLENGKGEVLIQTRRVYP